MALKFPDILEHNNSNLPLVDVTEMRGNTYPIGTLSQTGSIPESKRKIGAIVFVSSSQEFYGYYGQTSASGDWNTASNWRSLAATATSASFATTAATASYVPASAVVGLNLSSITNNTVTASVSTGANAFTLISGSTTLLNVTKEGVISGLTLSVTDISASSALVTNTITANTITATSASFGYVQTITGSAVIIGQEYIILNTQLPAARFAGLKIFDSGSSNATASIVWDSQRNHIVYQNATGSSYSGGGLMSGPRNTGSLGEESYPTLNRILRGQGGDHLYDSNIIDNDVKVSIGINTEITGTLTVSSTINGSLTGTASFATTAGTAASATSASYASNADTLDNLNSSDFVQISGNQGIAGIKTFTDIVNVGKGGTSSGQIDFVEQSAGKKISLQSQVATADLAFLDNNGGPLLTLYHDGTGLELPNGTFLGNLTGNADTATTASYALNAATASYVPASAVVGLNLSQIANGAVTASTNLGANPFTVVSGSTTLFNITQQGLATVKSLTVSDNLIVNGTASIINTENLLVKDPFILINSGSSALSDSGIVSQYNTAGEGSAFYIDGADTGTYGRWAVAYGVQQGFNSVVADEYMVTAKKASGAPPAAPTWGGANTGYGNIYVNSDNGEIYIYA